MNRAADSSYARIVHVKTLLKSLIVWLMLLAIPFQGFASATMLVCAPMESMPQLAVMAIAPVSTHHADAAATGHQHHADAAASGHQHHADDAAHVAADDGAAAHHHADGKCNSCATCCFGAIMAPSSASRIPPEMQHFAFLSFEADRIASVDLAHPERPPQTSLT